MGGVGGGLRTTVDKQSKQGADKAAYETASAEQIERSPNGTVAHRSYQCPALRSERTRHAPKLMLDKAEADATGNLAYERGLTPSISS